MTLNAYPDVVVVDAGQSSGETTIVYERSSSMVDAFLWDRVLPLQQGTSGLGWQRVDPTAKPNFVSASGDPAQDGSYLQPVRVGEVYQVRLYDEPGFDPNAHSFRGMKAEVSVVALLKEPVNRQLITDQTAMVVGGTFCSKTVATGIDTFFRFQVSDRPPTIDAKGMLRFATPLHSVTDGFGTSHTKEIKPLLPGNNFFAIIRVSDAAGNWQEFQEAFTTKQRKVTVSLAKLFIVNDGDPFDDSHANFAFYVKEGAVTVETFRDDWDIADGQTIPLAFPPVVIGPKTIDRQNHDITLFIAGTDEDGPTETDEVAANFLGNSPLGARSIEFPTGPNEQVQNKPHEFKAKPRSSDDDFEFTVTANFSIEYN